jgi:hypothetical protein
VNVDVPELSVNEETNEWLPSVEAMLLLTDSGTLPVATGLVAVCDAPTTVASMRFCSTAFALNVLEAADPLHEMSKVSSAQVTKAIAVELAFCATLCDVARTCCGD